MNQQSVKYFPTIVGSSIHDLKNSLTTIKELIGSHAKNCKSSNNQDFVKLELESRRMNNCLMHLLTLYKMEISRFSPSIEEHSVADILDEVVAQQSPTFSSQAIVLEIDCSETVNCYCDFELISNAICTILDNSQRYARSKILLSCKTINEYIAFTIEDDGEGYPEALLNTGFTENSSVDFCNGSTGLGMFFVHAIVQMHKNGEKKGYIKLDNSCSLGGARFTLFLP